MSMWTDVQTWIVLQANLVLFRLEEKEFQILFYASREVHIVGKIAIQHFIIRDFKD